MSRIEEYAEVIVRHGVGLRPGQKLFIRGRRRHKDLALGIGAAGYEYGAGEVRYHLVDQEELAQLIRCGSSVHIETYLERDRAFNEEILETHGAFVLMLDDCSLDPCLAQAMEARPDNQTLFYSLKSKFTLDFQHRATTERLVAGTVVPHPTEMWAGRVFPDLERREALERLWENILSFALVNQATISERERRQRERIAYLNDLEIRELLVTGGGNELRVALSDRARWHSSLMETATGQSYYLNYPSDEIFTTPDARYTEGRLVATRPLQLWGGSMVEDLVLEFTAGELVSCSATTGEDAFRSCISATGGNRLGEFALVGADSPIGRSRLFYHLPHLDENAASHIALGHGIATCLAGGAEMSREALEARGFNHSTIHTDILFGSSEVSVVATETRHGEVVAVKAGKFTKQ